jgi:hypothetical protein
MKHDRVQLQLVLARDSSPIMVVGGQIPIDGIRSKGVSRTYHEHIPTSPLAVLAGLIVTRVHSVGMWLIRVTCQLAGEVLWIEPPAVSRA